MTVSKFNMFSHFLSHQTFFPSPKTHGATFHMISIGALKRCVELCVLKSCPVGGFNLPL